MVSISLYIRIGGGANDRKSINTISNIIFLALIAMTIIAVALIIALVVIISK